MFVLNFSLDIELEVLIRIIRQEKRNKWLDTDWKGRGTTNLYLQMT